ncbi:MAG: hypothetical protein DRP09_19620 [Candidatus Thorarchaeota archaeon]|nr:MAG: hypothetical protein DRP09_19620 [Candidatus Thorarchaeota archaeon]
MDKWTRHQGIISVEIDGDVFDLKITNKELPSFYKMGSKIEKSGLTEENLKEFENIMVAALKNCNKDVSDEVIREFVKNNLMHLMIGVQKAWNLK